jgi:hypothetical protein
MAQHENALKHKQKANLERAELKCSQNVSDKKYFKIILMGQRFSEKRNNVTLLRINFIRLKLKHLSRKISLSQVKKRTEQNRKSSCLIPLNLYPLILYPLIFMKYSLTVGF